MKQNKTKNKKKLVNAEAVEVGELKFVESFSGRVDRASATEAVDSVSIPGRVKPKD